MKKFIKVVVTIVAGIVLFVLGKRVREFYDQRGLEKEFMKTWNKHMDDRDLGA